VELGYVKYTIDVGTRKLTYEISDWVAKCSGAECQDGAVYATPGYGFLCLPRNITERLYRTQQVFDEADAWLDLWCHTAFEDQGNAFSFLAPVVQYGKYGSILTLERLGKRWRWEKTKVWRFFKKHAAVFGLHRLPSNYGCIIFNQFYPTGTDIQLPDSLDIVSILTDILTSDRCKYKVATANGHLNRIVVWYSRKVIAARLENNQQQPEESPVAHFNLLTHAYISHGWNSEHCRNCSNACPGSLTGEYFNQRSGYQIRGPCFESGSFQIFTRR